MCAAKYLHSFVLSYFVRSGAEVSYNFISGSTSGSTRTVQYHKYFLYVYTYVLLLFVPFEDMKINTSYKYESTNNLLYVLGPTVHVHKVCAAKYLHSFVLSYFVRSGAEVSYNFILPEVQ